MNYIINPMWFYWLDVVDKIGLLTLLIMVLSLVATVVCGLVWISSLDYYDDAENRKMARVIKILIAIFFVFLLITVFIPTKTTLIEMQIARYATVENTEWTIEAIKSAVDYIVKAIAELK